MPIEIITKTDLDEFRKELLQEIKNVLISSKTLTQAKPVLKSCDVKKMLNVSSNTLQSMRDNGEIPYTKIGGSFYYEYDEILRAIKDNKNVMRG